MALSGANKDGREVRIYEYLEELSTDLADYIAELSEASVKERGVFAVALSGGSLISLMGKLCEAPYSKTVDWAKWYIFWVDERVVAKNHAESNYKLAKDGLLSKGCLEEGVWAKIRVWIDRDLQKEIESGLSKLQCLILRG